MFHQIFATGALMMMVGCLVMLIELTCGRTPFIGLLTFCAAIVVVLILGIIAIWR